MGDLKIHDKINLVEKEGFFSTFINGYRNYF